MTAKEYLQQIRKIYMMIEHKQKQLEELCDLTTSISSNLTPDKVQTSGPKDKIGDTVAKIIDLKNDINNDIDRLVDLKREIVKVVDQLDAPYLELIYLRYFDFKTWEEIACQMNYCFRQVLRLHDEALKKIDDVIECHI